MSAHRYQNRHLVVVSSFEIDHSSSHWFEIFGNSIMYQLSFRQSQAALLTLQIKTKKTTQHLVIQSFFKKFYRVKLFEKHTKSLNIKLKPNLLLLFR